MAYLGKQRTRAVRGRYASEDQFAAALSSAARVAERRDVSRAGQVIFGAVRICQRSGLPATRADVVAYQNATVADGPAGDQHERG